MTRDELEAIRRRVGYGTATQSDESELLRLVDALMQCRFSIWEVTDACWFFGYPGCIEHAFNSRAAAETALLEKAKEKRVIHG